MRAHSSSSPCMCGALVGRDVRSTSEFLIECHFCAEWFHGKCVDVNEVDAMEIAKYSCPRCAHAGHATVKYQSSGSHAVDDLAYAPLPIQRQRLDRHDAPGRTDDTWMAYRKNSDLFRRTLRAAIYACSRISVLTGEQFDPSYFAYHPFDDPILVHDAARCHAPTNAQLSTLSSSTSSSSSMMPTITTQDISVLLSTNACTVRAVDVATQTAFQLSASQWHAHIANQSLDTPANAHFRVLDTAFRHDVHAPHAVTAIDWHGLAPTRSARPPQPDIYGAWAGAGTFVDFTLAPDASATWLAVAAGEVTVFLIEPTSANWTTFLEWKSSSSSTHAGIFLAERVAQCTKCIVPTGSTLLVPSGWIYALYTAQSSSFFTGFFRTTLTLSTQLGARRHLEENINVAADWHQASFPHGWPRRYDSNSGSSAVFVPFNAQLWSMLCHYIDSLSSNEVLRVSDEDKHALRLALPALRVWSASPHAIERMDTVSWLPSSIQEATTMIDQLDQILHITSTNGGISANSSLSKPNMDERDHSMLTPLTANEASYLYAAIDHHSPSQSTPNDLWDTTTPHLPIHQQQHPAHYPSTSTSSLWDFPSYSMDPLVSAATPPTSSATPPYYHHSPFPTEYTDPTMTHSFATSPPHTIYGTTTTANFMDPPPSMRSPLSQSALPSSSPHQPQSSSSTSSMGGLINTHTLLDVSNIALPGIRPSSSPTGLYNDVLVRHRASCHRCGNLRKKNVRCPKCPHIFCQKCAEKMIEEHGDRIFTDGCPVCKELCCCGKNRSMMCLRKFHCYKKCPATKRPTV